MKERIINMDFNEFLEYFLNNYLEGKCRSFFKGPDEPILVIKSNSLPYYVSPQSELSEVIYHLCKNKTLLNSIFIALLLLKVSNKKLNWIIASLLMNQFSKQEIYNGIFIFIFLGDSFNQ